MTTLTLLGLASLLFILAFTLHAWFSSGAAWVGRQTRRQALLESWLNICIGFSINAAANWWLIPLVGGTLTASTNWWIGVIYTAISLVRSFVIRRYFEGHIHHLAARAAQRIS
jgi:hypothetical protein